MCYEEEREIFERFLMSLNFGYIFYPHNLRIFKFLNLCHIHLKGLKYLCKIKRKYLKHKRALHVHRYGDNSNLMEKKLFGCVQIREVKQ